MIEKTIFTLPFSATVLSLVSKSVISSFLEKLDYDTNQHFLLMENPGVRQVPIDKIVGRVVAVRMENHSYVADFEIYKTDYTNFVKDLIKGTQIRVSWRVDMEIELENNPFSRFCYFYEYKKYRIKDIQKVCCFFLEYFEE